MLYISLHRRSVHPNKQLDLSVEHNTSANWDSLEETKCSKLWNGIFWMRVWHPIAVLLRTYLQQIEMKRASSDERKADMYKVKRLTSDEHLSQKVKGVIRDRYPISSAIIVSNRMDRLRSCIIRSRIFMILYLHPFRSCIAFGRSAGRHPES